MAKNDVTNLNSANFTPAGTWNFSNAAVNLSGLANVSAAQVVYINPANGLLSRAVLAAGGGAVNVLQTALQGPTSGTFTVNANTLFALVELWGAGAGGGGAVGGGAGNYAAGGGGGGGGYNGGWYLKAALGSSFTYVLGAGGTGGGAGGGSGNNGAISTTSLGASIAGGIGGGGSGAIPNSFSIAGGGPGVASGPGINYPGQNGDWSLLCSTAQFSKGGRGGDSSGTRQFFGGQSLYSYPLVANRAGAAAQTGLVGGGSGAATSGSASDSSGGNGGHAYLLVTEFLSV